MPGILKHKPVLFMSVIFVFFLLSYPTIYRRLLEAPLCPYLKARKLSCLRMLIDSDGLHSKIGRQLLNSEEIFLWHNATAFSLILYGLYFIDTD
jgi:hypothetical protein